MYFLVNHRQSEQHPDRCLADDWLELFLVYLLYDQRDRDYDIGLDLGKSIHYYLGAGYPGKEMYVCTDSHFEEELEHHAVHMGRGKHCHHIGCIVELRMHTHGELHIGDQSPVR